MMFYLYDFAPFGLPRASHQKVMKCELVPPIICGSCLNKFAGADERVTVSRYTRSLVNLRERVPPLIRALGKPQVDDTDDDRSTKQVI